MGEPVPAFVQRLSGQVMLAGTLGYERVGDLLQQLSVRCSLLLKNKKKISQRRNDSEDMGSILLTI